MSQPRISSPVVVRLAALCGALVFSAAAAAQWAWKDENGRVVYSDRPPPTGVAQDRIVRQPGGVPVARSDGSEPRADGKSESKSGPKTWSEREAEFRKRQSERADADKKAAESRSEQAQRRGDCERARSYVATLESGLRVARTNAQGEREYLEDAQRASELTRAREVAAANCN